MGERLSGPACRSQRRRAVLASDPGFAGQSVGLVGRAGWSFTTFRLVQRSDRSLKKIAPDFGFEYQETVVESTPYLVLPETWDQYLATLSTKQRKAQKRNIRLPRRRDRPMADTENDGRNCAGSGSAAWPGFAFSEGGKGSSREIS